MIDQVLPPILDELNKFMKSKHNITEDKVVLSSIVNSDGSIAIQEVDKIIMTVANIEIERGKSNTGKYEQSKSGGFTKVLPPVNVAIQLLFSAYFTSENYLEGLKFISSTIAFFQSRGGIFDAQNTPKLAGILPKLYAELISMDSRELSNVWGGLGAKYMPSVLYKLKVVPIEHRFPAQTIPSVRNI